MYEHTHKTLLLPPPPPPLLLLLLLLTCNAALFGYVEVRMRLLVELKAVCNMLLERLEIAAT